MKTRVRYLRRMRTWTQVELANRAGVSNQTIVNIERYGKEPTVGTIRKLAKAFAIDPSELFAADSAQADGTVDDEELRKKNKAA